MGLKLFADNIKLLGNVAGYAVDRHSLITGNIANMETPNYKTKDISFEAQLQAALPDKNDLKMVKTNERHFPTYDASGQVRPQIVTGGDVDLDKQMARLAENNLKYNTMVQLLNRKYKAVKETIEQGGR